MNKSTTLVEYCAGCPPIANSKWQRLMAVTKRCKEAGWQIILVCCNKPEYPPLIEPFQNIGVEVLIFPRSNRSIDFASIKRIYQLLKSKKCDIFHCDNDHTSPLVGAALARVPVRIWSSLSMSSYHEHGILPQGWHRLMPSVRLSYYCAHRILSISQDIHTELVNMGAPKDRIEVVHGAVDIKPFTVSTNNDIRQELGLGFSDVLISTVGSAIPIKGWDIAIKAFAKVLTGIPDAHLVLVGDKSSGEKAKEYIRLKELCESYGISKKTFFLGYRDDYRNILKASNIFVLPSRSEGLPAALLEAMAAGLPCVASRIGGISEVITHGKDGLLFERENVKELSMHLIRLIEDQQISKTIAFNATIRAADFSMEKYVEKVFHTYEFLLNKNTKTTVRNEPSFTQT